VYAEDVESNVFLSWQWLHDQFKRRAGIVCILAVKVTGDISGASQFCAFMPLKKQLVLSRQDAEFMMVYRLAGNYWADYTGLICRPDSVTHAIPELGRCLAQLPWAKMYLECLKISDTRLQLLLAPLNGYPFARVEKARRDTADAYDLLRAPRIALPASFDDYLAQQVSANTRQRIRRYWRKFENDSSLVIRSTTDDTQEQDLQSFERLWAQRWRHDKGSKTESLARRYRLIIAQGLDSRTLQVQVMERRGRCVAMNANYIDPVRREVLFYVGARDQSFTELPAGLLLQVQAVRDAIDQGYRFYDFLSGDEPYKYSLGASDQQLHSLVLSRDPTDCPGECPGLRLERALDPECLETALSELMTVQRTGSDELVEKLYAQLKLAWPDEIKVVRSHEKWRMKKHHTRR
jgi:hypothetical protein